MPEDQPTYEDLMKIIKAIAAYNAAEPIRFNRAYLDYADNINITFTLSPEEITITYKGMR